MKTKIASLASLSVLALSLPYIALAQCANGFSGANCDVAIGSSGGGGNAGSLGGLFSIILTDINSYIVPLIFAIAFIVFLWGVFQYFVAGGADEGKRADGRNFILYGIIGFVIMFSLWGIVNILIHTFPGIDGQNRPDLPTFQP